MAKELEKIHWYGVFIYVSQYNKNYLLSVKNVPRGLQIF